VDSGAEAAVELGDARTEAAGRLEIAQLLLRLVQYRIYSTIQLPISLS